MKQVKTAEESCYYGHCTCAQLLHMRRDICTCSHHFMQMIMTKCGSNDDFDLKSRHHIGYDYNHVTYFTGMTCIYY